MSCEADTTINLLNTCTQDLTACQTSSSGSIACYVLSANGGSYSLDVGTTWTGGVVWAFPASSGTDTTTGNNAKPQANLAEFTINSGGEDYYDISLVVHKQTWIVINRSQSLLHFFEQFDHFLLLSLSLLPERNTSTYHQFVESDPTCERLFIHACSSGSQSLYIYLSMCLMIDFVSISYYSDPSLTRCIIMSTFAE